jgi:hypothetical protein
MPNTSYHFIKQRHCCAWDEGRGMGRMGLSLNGINSVLSLQKKERMDMD